MGCGRTGSTLAQMCEARGHSVAVIDQNPEAFRRLGTAFEGLHRFDEWRHALGIASNVLSQRLGHLVKSGCLTRVGEGRPVYRLTPMGEALYPTALMFWRLDHRWPGATPPAPRVLVHTACGAAMTTRSSTPAARTSATTRTSCRWSESRTRLSVRWTGSAS